MLFTDRAVNIEQDNAEDDRQHEQRLVGGHGGPASDFLQVLRQAGTEGANRAHDRANKRVQSKHLISVLRLTFFGEQRLFDRIKRSAAGTTATGTARADIGDDDRQQDKNQAAEKNINAIGDNRQHG